jgi:HK97 family phage major capsid protein
LDIKAATEALRLERMNVINQLNAKLDETAGRERSEEEKTVIARMDARIDEIDAEVRDMARRYQREVDAAAIRSANESLFGEVAVDRREKRETDTIRSWISGGMAGAFEVRDLWAARNEALALRAGATPDELRVMNYQTSSGSLVVPTTLARTLYQYLEAGISGFRIGARVVNTSTGEPIQFPRLSAHSISAGSIPQGTAIGGTDPTFARTQLDSYKYGQLVAVSSELVDDSAFDIGSWLAEDIGRGMGRLIDTDLVVGVGTANPKGMTVLAGAGTNAPVKTGGSLITPTYETLVDLVYSVNDAYRASGAAWLLKDSTAGTLRKLRDGAGGTVGAVLWEPSLTAGIQNGEPDRLMGYPVFTDPNCASQGSNAVVATFGWFGEYVIRTVGSPIVERDNSVYFATDQVAVRGKWRVDGDHLDVSALNNLVQNV